MKTMKIKLVARTTRVILLFSVVFLLSLLIYSTNWFFENFGEVEFATVIYQLLSPLQGTATEVLQDYCGKSLYPAILWAAGFAVLYEVMDLAFRVLYFEFRISIFGKTFKCRQGKWFWAISKCVIIGGGFLAATIVINKKVTAMGLWDYISDMTHSSTIFEEQYVDPADIQITFPEQKRNLLFIYLESMETTYASVEAGGGKPVNYIPELTELAFDYVSFSDDEDLGGACQAKSTGFTIGGLLGSLTGVPYKLPVQDVNDGKSYNESFLPGIITMGDILSSAGYRNYFMCGSEAEFAGRQLLFTQHGDYEIFDVQKARETGFISEDYQVYWGMEDQKLYEFAQKELTEIAKQEQPFNFAMLTVDTHAPGGYRCELCSNEYPTDYENAVVCSSRQASEFIAWVVEQEWYKDTTVVIMGDHLSMKKDFWDDIEDYKRRIYNCFINVPEEMKEANTKNRIFTTLDMFPTTLAALNIEIEGDRLGLGTNLFSERATIPEEMGIDVFNSELALDSNYYNIHFVLKK